MMTVKHVTEGGKQERIEQVDAAEYNAETWKLIGYRNGKPTIEFTGGHAYVSNELGKTVGVYNLGEQKV